MSPKHFTGDKFLGVVAVREGEASARCKNCVRLTVLARGQREQRHECLNVELARDMFVGAVAVTDGRGIGLHCKKNDDITKM